ncbi:MAG: hypothetical protein CL397_15495 [Acidiferrobacteraceae bacterium]|nr:hypothetical protein [Acidiferrobacteraceae bacterium]
MHSPQQLIVADHATYFRGDGGGLEDLDVVVGGVAELFVERPLVLRGLTAVDDRQPFALLTTHALERDGLSRRTGIGGFDVVFVIGSLRHLDRVTGFGRGRRLCDCVVGVFD